MKIAGKTVVITGASSGLGAALAQRMWRAGAARLILLGRHEARLNQVVRALQADGADAHAVLADLSHEDDVHAVVDWLRAHAGPVDILVNNAGAGAWNFLEDSTFAEIREAMAVPYLAAAWLSSALLPAMRQRQRGHIVNISSVASTLVWPGATAYIAACRAMRGLSDALAADLRGSGVHVTHYESGPIETPYWATHPQSRARVPGIARLLVRPLSADEAADAIIRGVEGQRRHVVAPVMMAAVLRLHGLVPWAVRGLMVRTGFRL